MQSPSEDILDFLISTKPLGDLPLAVYQELVSSCSVKKFASKQFIFKQGQQGELGYIVLSGRIAMISTTNDAREMIIELLPSGEPFGIVVFLNDSPSYPLSARAQIESKVICIHRSVFRQLVEKNSALYEEMLKIFRERLKSSHNVSRALAHDRVEVRIAATLSALIARPNAALPNYVDIGRQELADTVGATIETASRICKQLEKDGILDLKMVGKVGILDNNALLKIATGS